MLMGFNRNLMGLKGIFMGFKGHGFAKLVSHQENGCIYVGYRGDTMGYITDLAI